MKAQRFNSIFTFDCPFGEDDDCTNSIIVETDEGNIYDVTGCNVHVAGELTTKQRETLGGMIEYELQGLYDAEIDRRIDEKRERDLND